jgi:hypothetical protein
MKMAAQKIPIQLRLQKALMGMTMVSLTKMIYARAHHKEYISADIMFHPKIVKKAVDPIDWTA